VAGKAMTREDLEKNPPRPGTPVDESKTEPMDFSKDVKALLDDAKALAKDDKNLLALVDGVKINTGKGSVGGPWTSPSKVLGPGDSHTYTFNFVGGEQAYINVSSDQPVNLAVYRPNGSLVKDFNGRVSDISWTPDATKPFTVYVSNLTNRRATYTIYKN